LIRATARPQRRFRNDSFGTGFFEQQSSINSRICPQKAQFA
jgi:hypothetical protein